MVQIFHFYQDFELGKCKQYFIRIIDIQTDIQQIGGSSISSSSSRDEVYADMSCLKRYGHGRGITWEYTVVLATGSVSECFPVQSRPCWYERNYSLVTGTGRQFNQLDWQFRVRSLPPIDYSAPED
eukprot:TRINITY_DN2066_c1_g2_i10.p4 TRINITY_DN2066_c1_g2~~TRINITY_DN2066_c1_g2_i10.p4  ORF type:complete len:126 (-),score=3.32 TRINITY_DN2066_c1_g2_i10:139-516(-)